MCLRLIENTITKVVRINEGYIGKLLPKKPKKNLEEASQMEKKRDSVC